jgi:hypothetical protein
MDERAAHLAKFRKSRNEFEQLKNGERGVTKSTETRMVAMNFIHGEITLLLYITKDSDRNFSDTLKLISGIRNSKITIGIPSIVIGMNLTCPFPASSPLFS